MGQCENPRPKKLQNPAIFCHFLPIFATFLCHFAPLVWPHLSNKSAPRPTPRESKHKRSRIDREHAKLMFTGGFGAPLN